MPIGPVIVETMRRDAFRVDTIAHNLANAAVNGFKRTMVVDDGKTFQAVVDQMHGMARQTGRSLDMSIEGAGYFVVAAPDGRQLLTRQGSFRIGSDGTLQNSDGLKVQGEGGDLRLDPQQQATVDADGTIRQGSSLVGKLRMVVPENVQQLLPVGSASFQTPVNANLQPATGRVESSMLELSNVNPLNEMTDFLTATRAFEFGQKALQIDGDIRRKLTEDVGRTR